MSSRVESVEEAKRLIRSLAGLEGNKKERVWRAARKLGMSFSRAKDVWYGNARLILSEEMDALRKAAKCSERSVLSRAESYDDDSRSEFREIVETLARIEKRMSALFEFMEGETSYSRGEAGLEEG